MSSIEEYCIGKEEEVGLLLAELDSILTLSSPEDVEQRIIQFDTKRSDIHDGLDSISKAIGELEDKKRGLANLRRKLKLAMDRMDAYRWSLLSSRKAQRA